MERQIATTSEQSSRLLRCGVPADTADMIYSEDCGFEVNVGGRLPDGCTPAWSLSRLLEILPPHVEYAGYKYFLNLCNKDVGWVIFYERWDSNHHGIGYTGGNLIKAAVQLIEWLTANGYKLNENK